MHRTAVAILMMVVAMAINVRKAVAQVGMDSMGDRGGGLIYVASKKAVREECKVDGQAAAALDKLVTKYGQLLARQDRNDAAAKNVNLEFLAEMKTTITADQLSRMKHISWQLFESFALEMDPEVEESLKLEAVQIAKIASVNQDFRARFRELLATGSGPSSPKRRELDVERNKAAIAVLSDDQRDKWAALKGESFDVSSLLFRPPGPGAQSQFVETGPGGIFSVMNNDSVQKELRIDQNTSEKLTLVKDQFEATWREAGGRSHLRHIKMQSGPLRTFPEAAMPPLGIARKESEDQRNKEIEKMMVVWNNTKAKFVGQIRGTLTDQQFLRLMEIDLQAMGTAAFWDVDVIKEIGISDEQRERIVNIICTYNTKRLEAIRKSRNENEQKQVVAKRVEDSNRELDMRVDEILSQSQREAFQRMKGTPFDVRTIGDVDTDN